MADETCLDETMRDLLPLLAHDALEGSEAQAARAHVAGCTACRAELALLRSAAAAISAAAPQVSTARILAGVQRATRLRVEPAMRVSRRMGGWMPRRYAAAAASVLLVVSASLAVLARTFGEADPTVEGAASAIVDSSGGRVMASAAAGLSVTGGLSDLDDDELTVLLDELDRVEATVAAEPSTLRRALVDDQENF
jgi:anti-sigma factor RsiW